MNSYELGNLLACKQTEVEDLRRQLEQAHADIAGLHDQLEEPQITQDEYKLELDQLRKQLAAKQAEVDAAVAACKIKDDALTDTVAALEHRWEVIANRAAPIMESVIDSAHTKGIEALAVKPSISNWAAHQRPSEWKTNDELRDLLRPFAALLQKHNGDGPDEQPMLQINDAKITRGDLRRALAATTPKEQLG